MSDFINDYQQLLDRYKYSLLCNLENIDEIEAEIKIYVRHSVSEDIAQIQAFVDQHKSILNQAFDFGKKGTSKESGEFQYFLDSVKKINDMVVTQAVLHSYNQGLEKYNAEYSIESIAESIFSNSFKTNNNYAEIDSLLNEIMQYRTWTNDASKQAKLKDNCEQIESLDPAKGKEARKLLEVGKQIDALYTQAFKSGTQGETQLPEELIKSAKKLGATKQEIKKLHLQFSKGKEKRNLFRTAPNTNIPEIPQYDIGTNHPFYISNLQEEKHWRIFIDETGKVFDQSVFLPETDKKQRGKFVALFIPDKSKLPALGKHHATEESTEKNQNVLATLLNKGSNCGILGITLEAMARVDLDYWYAGLERLFDISLRLLPVSDSCVKLDFYVENRGEVNELDTTAAMIQRTADVALFRFAKSFPEKANLIKLKTYCMAKKQTNDQYFNNYNGYVDTVACAWSGGRKELKKMLSKSGFINRCLLEGNIQEFPAIMDQLAIGEPINIHQWNELLNSPDRAVVDSPINTLLAQLGLILQQDINIWETYVNDVLQHLDSKAINLTSLDKQIKWLTANMPLTTELPKRLKIIWLTSMLAEKNHQGVIEEHFSQELKNILPEMYLEDTPLCCWSTLHQAVTKTNAFCFDEARKLVQQFCANFDLLPQELTYNNFCPNGKYPAPEMTKKIAIVGLKYYGQLLSTLGQHEAFSGNHKQANEYFLCAMRCFSLLSDGGIRDISQTMSYYIINLMDNTKEPQNMLSQIEEYLNNSLTDAVGKMADRKDVENKYRHHIMLRYFQLLPKENPAIRHYLSYCHKWKTDDGHPWEMIEFYRAMLCDNQSEKLVHLRKAYDIAKSGGLTLQVIAAVILGAIYFYDESVKQEFEKLVQHVRNSVPALAERGSFLEQQLHRNIEPLELAKQVLPFNFR